MTPQTKTSKLRLDTAQSRFSRNESALSSDSEESKDEIVLQPKRPTFNSKRLPSHWKDLHVPDFYLTTLKGCSTGHVPSVFFEKQPAVSTAGNVEVEAFHVKPLPTDPKHRTTSMEYFAPKGFGRLLCQVCSRYFMNEDLLAQHCSGSVHRYKAAKLEGFKKAPRPIPGHGLGYNMLDCGEFDEAYHAMKSGSESEPESDDVAAEEEGLSSELTSEARLILDFQRSERRAERERLGQVKMRRS
jgi:hypothetical protein